MDNKEIAQALLQIGTQLNQLALGILGAAPVAVETVSAPVVSREIPKAQVVKMPKRAVSYDNDPSSPSYDPEPPFVVEQLPPRDIVADNRVILKKDQQIKCGKCGHIILNILSDVHADKIQGSAFEVAIEGMELEDLVISKGINAPGLYADCPVCNAPKGVRLFGVVEKAQESTRTTEGVVSI